MEHPEIDEWYSREKEKISDEYKANLKKTKNLKITELRKKFEKKHKKLIANYNKKYNMAFKTEDIRKKTELPGKKISLMMDQLADLFSEKDD